MEEAQGNATHDPQETEKILLERDQPEEAREQGWTGTIRYRIGYLTAPLTERYENHPEEKSEEAAVSEPTGSESVFQKIADLAAPQAESSESKDEKATVPKQVSEDGIMQRIANLASPLTDYINSYTKTSEDLVPETSPKENVMQKLKDRFDKKHTAKTVEPTWKDKLMQKTTNLISPLTDRFNIPVNLNGFGMIDLTNNQVLAALGGILLLLLFLLVTRRRAKRDQTPSRRTRSPSRDAARTRARSGSFDALLARSNFLRDRSGTTEDPLDVAINQHDDTPLVFGGAGVPSISYETWTPPMQWSEASRMLLPINSKPEKQRKVTLNFEDGTLTRDGVGGKQQTFAMTDLSLYVKPPTTGGIIKIYVKGAPKEEWMEHTFKSAHQAAQFQHDLINYQVVGESIMNMYGSLELIQKGSLAHDGKECVLHDDTADSKKSAVAWDDAMRCFSGIIPLRHALETVQVQSTINNGDKEEGEETALAEDYVNNRLLLGHFDFFRLFVPTVEAAALPLSESSPARVNELLERRKRVARAAVMVQSYVRARAVANKGWKLSKDLPEGSFTKRLAYDQDIDNIQRDSTAKNEYYEGTVSRDIVCEVHSVKHLQKPGSSVMSQYQAFSLVGSHVFKLPTQGEQHALSHRKDPVLSLPTLQKLVEAHPELDFFICAFFPAGLGVAIVHAFVRSLPKGVDASFDTIVSSIS